MYIKGLPCVTMLIGVYELSTGRPVVGVINQPFWKRGSSSAVELLGRVIKEDQKPSY